MRYLQNGNELLGLFGDIQSYGYIEPTILNDVKVGFSVQKEYPKGIRFKSAKTQSGKDDNIACIWVVYESGREKDNNVSIPIRFRISMMSKYRTRHWFDDDLNDPEKPTTESLRVSQNSPQPVDLQMREGYFFSSSKNSLVDDKGNIVIGTVPLNELFEAHCKTVHIFLGLGIRGKQAAHKFSRGTLEICIDVSKWCLKNVFGRSLSERPDRSSYLDGYTLHEFGKLSEDCIEVFGYKITKRVLGVFIFLASIATYTSYPVVNNSYQEFVIHSEVLSTLHVLAALMFLEIVIPYVIFFFLNGLIYFRKRYVNWILN